MTAAEKLTDIRNVRKDNDLLINAGAYSRILSLPDTLENIEIDTASYEDNRLQIHFSKET